MEERLRLEHDRYRARLEAAADSAGQLSTINERVAWILNHYPETRDSDIPLWFRYWSVFESDSWDRIAVSLDDAKHLTKPTSIERARRTVQHDYGLFIASPTVRARRGKLAEEERQKAIETDPPSPLYSVYADESGKNDTHLIVASVWFLLAPELVRMRQAIQRVKDQHSFDGELHFKEIDRSNVGFYGDVVDTIGARSAAVSFKAVTIERRGIGRQDLALADLFYHLIVRGVIHEHETGRARLPRRIKLTKDLEEIGADRLMLANLRDRVAQFAAATLEGELRPTEFIPMKSDGHEILQVADLFAGSLHRVLNKPGAGPKDDVAAALLQRVGMPHGPEQLESMGDATVRIAL